MELKDFITRTLSDIIEGVISTQKLAQEKGAVINSIVEATNLT